ncbi:ThiF family adenylyltransferase [Natronocella acetinitrilica]|uniref:ThiF family adenylyltransferase n=1 Tax=Natronocella acetinitrilica TaxID=414046 RepID=UPI003F50706D
MPDRTFNAGCWRRAAAIAALDDHFTSCPGVDRLGDGDLSRRYGRRFSLGWRVRVEFHDGIRHELHLLADDRFPYTPVRVAVADAPPILTWPHLEKGVFLCTLSQDAAVSSDNPVSATLQILGDACRLVEENLLGCNTDDFRQEFLSYWALAVDRCALQYISLLDPRGPSRSISMWWGQRTRVAGEDSHSLYRWLKRWGADPRLEFLHGMLVWLPEPLLPAEYPRTVADVRALARERSPEAEEILETLMASGPQSFDVVIGAPTVNGACLAAVTMRRPSPQGAPGRQQDGLTKGFRPGRVPESLLAARYRSGVTRVIKANVERADHEWIHGRDQDPRQDRLRQFRVAVLGCGSLGGPVARMLAQAGVGNLLLVDPEDLGWSNVSRHNLGVPSVNRGKSREVGREIERAYPHLREITARQERVGLDATDLQKDLLSCDLIISAMGNWPAESFLNDLQKDNNAFPPVIYGWLEPQAAAAHALLVEREGPCLRCGTDDLGRPHRTVTVWRDADANRQAPACGAQFTPYGPSELAWGHALLAEAAIDALLGEAGISTHRVWIASRPRIEGAGGAWSTKWIEEVGDPGEGGSTVRAIWRADPSCPVCHRRARVA